MDFIIQHENASYMRLHLRSGHLTAAQAEVLEYALTHLKGVCRVKLYPSSGGIAFSYKGDRDYILKKLRSFQFRNVKLFAEEIDERIDHEELARRKLSPEVKDRLRRKVLIETAADILMPMPLQVGYHIYQLITLKNL